MANLGSLVVSLEANMAKFQTDMQKSAAVTEQSMAKMALSSEQATAAITRLEGQFGKAGNAALSMGKNLLLGAAVGLSFEALAKKISGVIESMANLKHLSEKTGASVENLSKLGFVAKQSGSDIDSVANAINKLSKGMAGADNETKGAGLAMSYLGVKAKDAAGDLKDPAVMFTEIAKRLNTYQDGAGKAAIAQALFGKAGAEMLPTLKLLGEQGELVAKVTDQQATAARDYTRDLVKLDIQKNMLFKTLAVALLPTMTDFAGVLLEASKETNVLNKAAKDLSNDNTITSWADAGAMGIARLIDVIKLVPPLVTALSGSFKAVWADVELAAKASTMLNPVALAASVASGKNPYSDFKAQLNDRNKTLAESNAAYDKLWNMEGNSTEKAMQKRIAARKTDRTAQIADAAAAATAEKAKPKLNYNTSGEDKAAAGGPKDDPARKLLQGQMAAQEAFIAAEKTQLATRESYLQYYYQLEYTNASDYYGTKNKLIQDALADQLAAYDKEAAAATIYLAQADTETKKQDARNILADIGKKRTAAEIEINKKLTDSVMEQDAIYRRFALTTEDVAHQAGLANAQARFQIDLLGKGTLEVAKLTEAKRIDLALEQRLYDIRNKGLPEAEAARAAAEALTQKASALQLIEDSYNAQRTAIFGATEAMRKYAETTSNQAAQVEGAFTNSFKSAEDAATKFFRTGKLGIKDFANVVLDELARIQAKKLVASMVGGGGSGGIGGFLSSLFGSSGSTGNNPSAYVAPSGGGIGDFFKSVLPSFAVGTDNVPYDMVAQIHQGERIVPAAQNNGRSGGAMSINIVNQTTGRIDEVIQQDISPTQRNIIIREATQASIQAVAQGFGDPNHPVSKGFAGSYKAQRVRA